MTAASTTSQNATMLGRYRLIAELGRGGMASVYLAVLSGPAGFSKLTVVKEIRPDLAEDPDFLAMFLDEARLAARLSHPNIVQTNEVGSDGHRYFIAMEYLEGQAYNRLLSRLRERPLPLSAHLQILCGVLSALQHAHDLCDYDGKPLGVVHRDVTPQNVFVTYGGEVKLVDFGIAKAVTSTHETAAGVMKGKVAYMAPEQARGDKVDLRADLFSVGVMLWEAIANRRMWKGTKDIVVLQRLVAADIPAIHEAVPDVPPRLVALLRRALAPRAADRFASAAEMHAELEAVLADEPDAPGLREVGRTLSAAFQADRAKLRDVIERQLTALRNDETSALDALPLVETSAPLTNTGSGRRQAESGLEASMPTVPVPTNVTGSTNVTASVATATAAAAAAKSPWLPLGIALATALLVAGGLVLYRGGGAPEAAPAPLAAAPVGHTLTLTSEPPGAAIREGDRFLGTTPLTLPLSGTQTEVRIFVLEKPGFVPHSVSQPPSEVDVKVEAALVPEAAPPPSEPTAPSAAAAPAAVAAPSKRTVPKPVAPAPSPSPTTTSDKLNIRTKR